MFCPLRNLPTNSGANLSSFEAITICSLSFSSQVFQSLKVHYPQWQIATSTYCSVLADRRHWDILSTAILMNNRRCSDSSCKLEISVFETGVTNVTSCLNGVHTRAFQCLYDHQRYFKYVCTILWYGIFSGPRTLTLHLAVISDHTNDSLYGSRLRPQQWHSICHLRPHQCLSICHLRPHQWLSNCYFRPHQWLSGLQ